MSPYKPSGWPRKADSVLDRARTVARFYREALRAVDAAMCDRVDAHAVELGQGWVVPQVDQFEMDDLLSRQDAARFCSVEPPTLVKWESRGLKVRQTPDGPRYRVGDLIDYQASRRLRRIGRAT